MRASPSLRTTVWLAVRGGRTDLVRIVLTAAGSAAATVFMLAAAAVIWIGPDDGPYSSQLLSEPGLHQGIVAALVLLCIPVLAFVGHCSRIGAPARDRRLAAFRLSGATPRDVVRIVGAETGLAAGLGAVLGLGAYLAGRVVLDVPKVATYMQTTVSADGSMEVPEPVRGPVRALPTDVVPPWWAIAVVVIALSLGAVVFSQLALRRVAVSPFGVVRREHSRPPRALPAVVFLVGATGMAAFSALTRTIGIEESSQFVRSIVFFALFVVTGIGLIAGSAAIAAFIGNFAAARTGHPALLIAGRRLAATPFTTSRANAVILLAVLIGGITQGVRANILTFVQSEEPFYAETLNLVNLVLAVGLVLATAGVLVNAVEGVVSGRQELAALTATGTPRRVLRRALFLESLLPLAPMTVLAAGAGALAARGILGTSYERYGGRRGQRLIEVVGVPVPWVELGLLVAGTIVAVTLMTGVAAMLIRTSTALRELRVEA